MSDSVRPHRWQPIRLPHPWDSQGKNTGVGCHFLLQCMRVKSESKVAQSCLTLSHPMDCSPPGSHIHGVFQARVLETIFLKGSLKVPSSTSCLKDCDSYSNPPSNPDTKFYCDRCTQSQTLLQSPIILWGLTGLLAQALCANLSYPPSQHSTVQLMSTLANTFVHLHVFSLKYEDRWQQDRQMFAFLEFISSE